MNLSDIDIVNAVRRGDYNAYCELYRRFSDIVYRNILVRVNSSFDADDIFQDFFVKLWENREKLQIDSNVRGYLLVALKNHILNSIKESQIRLRHHGKQPGPDTDADHEWVKLVSRDILDQLQRVVDRFPPRMKAIYVQRREQDMSIKEIAEKLSISEQTVKNQLGESLRRLKNEATSKNFSFFA